MKTLISIILFVGVSQLAISQSRPISADSSMTPRFHIIYGDSVLSQENSSVLFAIVRLKQLHSMFSREVGKKDATLDDFMAWLDMRIIKGHSPAFTKKYLSER